MRTLEFSLGDHSLATLRAIADFYGIRLQSNVLRRAAEQLAQALLEPDFRRPALESCTAEAREALDSLLRSEGRILLASFERRYGAVRRFGPGPLAQERPQHHPANPTEELWYRGLIYRAFAQTPSGAQEFLYVPDDLAPLLPRPEPLAEGFALPAAPAPARVQPTCDRLFHDLGTLLGLVQSGQVRLAEPGNPLAWQAASLAELEQMLWPRAAGEGDCAALALALAGHLDWLRAVGRRLQLNARPVMAWLESARGRQRSQLLDAWRDAAGWNDLCRTPALHCEDTGSWSNDPVATRQRLLSWLARLDSSTWRDCADLARAIKRVDPDFQRPHGNYDTWYVRRRDTQAYLRGFENWDQVEGRLLSFLLAGPLHWLGAVDLGGDESRFRFTPAGIAWLAGREPVDEAEEGALQVLPDFAVMVPTSAPLRERFRVARFTTWEASGPPFCYRITQTGLKRAAAQGIDTGLVLQYLSHQTADMGGVPENVAAALRRWQAS